MGEIKTLWYSSQTLMVKQHCLQVQHSVRSWLKTLADPTLAAALEGLSYHILTPQDGTV